VETATFREITVAVKKVYSEQTLIPTTLAGIERELDVMRRLRNPHIVQFIGACLEPEILIVSELMEKGTLRKLLDKPKGREKLESKGGINRYKIAKHIAEAVAFIHYSQCVHCDLTSSNVLLGEKYIAKVGDFGLARVTGVSKLEQRGHCCWAAPELFRTKTPEFKPACDIFSFGIILWEMFSMKLPHFAFMKNDRPAIAYMKAVKEDLYRPPIPEHTAPSWQHLIQWCWDDDPRKRPTFTEVLAYIRTNKNKLVPKDAQHIYIPPLEIQPSKHEDDYFEDKNEDMPHKIGYEVEEIEEEDEQTELRKTNELDRTSSSYTNEV